MTVNWAYSAQSTFDQLESKEQALVMAALDGLEPGDLQAAAGSPKRIAGSAGLYSLKLGNDLRLILARKRGTLVVIDLVRRKQIAKLRRTTRKWAVRP